MCPETCQNDHMQECPERPGAGSEPDDHEQETEHATRSANGRPSPRCSHRCAFGYSSPALCTRRCSHAKYHGGSHDCMQHVTDQNVLRLARRLNSASPDHAELGRDWRRGLVRKAVDHLLAMYAGSAIPRVPNVRRRGMSLVLFAMRKMPCRGMQRLWCGTRLPMSNPRSCRSRDHASLPQRSPVWGTRRRVRHPRNGLGYDLEPRLDVKSARTVCEHRPLVRTATARSAGECRVAFGPDPV